MFGKNKVKRSLLSSFDLLYQVIIKDGNGEDPYGQMKQIAEALLENKPVLANFRNISDSFVANYVLAFLSGVCFSKDGNVFPISEETYLFATKEALSDGSIKSYLDEVEKR